MQSGEKLQFDSLWCGFHAATMQYGQYSSIKDAAIGVTDGKIAWIGEHKSLPTFKAAAKHDLNGGWLTPGLIDCHTHLVFGGNRAHEFEQRLQGKSYAEISKAGGGIASSVNATRNASEAELIVSATKRLQMLINDGVTTIEIKSGYGLNIEHELKMLRVAKSLQLESPITVIATCLAAHALPPEYKDDADGYIDFLCEQLLPAIAESGLADAVDAFCEGIGFSPEQIERYFTAATELGLPVKLHAEQLSALGGASLAARYQALSADHLEYATQTDVGAMANSGTVAVLLPGAFHTLAEMQLPPIELFRQYKVPMAVATDLNPGTSPALSLRLMMNMACTMFGLTPEESLAGVTINAAKALGIGSTHGELACGKVADFVCWDIASPGELSYWMGGELLKNRIYAGVESKIIES